MIWRFFCVIGLSLTLSGCLQTRIVTLVDGDGETMTQVGMTTNVVYASVLEQQFKQNNQQYIHKILPDGSIQFVLNETLSSDQFNCRGFFLKECSMDVRIPIAVNDPMMEAIIKEAMKGSDNEMMPIVSYVVILPKSARVKSTNAHEQYTDEDGLNLEWTYKPGPGDVLVFKFTAGI